MTDPMAKLRRIKRSQDEMPAAIVEAIDAGNSGTTIGKVLGLTKSRIYQIAREERARQSGKS